MTMLRALGEGFSAVTRNLGLAVFLLAVNLATALVLAWPLAATLERDLRETEAAGTLTRAFDYAWWSPWSEQQRGFARSFDPAILGAGGSFKNLDHLLKGELPAGLFAPGPPALDPAVLAVAAAYGLLQLFLAGGVLGVLRAPRGGWSVRALALGGGFYAGRLLRVALIALALAGLLFALHEPLATRVDAAAEDAVSETTALALTVGRRAALLFALLALHALSSFARVATVLEERSSALLAWLSSLSFCLRRLPAVAGQYAIVGLAAAALGLSWHLFDSLLFPALGALGTLLAGEVAVLAGLVLRLGLLGAQVALYRQELGGACGAPPRPPLAPAE